MDAMEEDDDASFENIDELNEAQILSQQFAEYVVSVSRTDTPREEKIQNLHRMAHLFEREETKFRDGGGNVLADDRDGTTLGTLLGLYAENEELHVELLNMIVHGSDADLILAAARLMLAANIGSSVPLAQTEDGEEELMDKLMALITADETTRPLRVFSIGVLAKLIEGIDLAGSVSTTKIPALLVKMLAEAMNVEILKAKDPDVRAAEEMRDREFAVLVPSVSSDVDAMQPKLDDLHISGISMRYRELNYTLVCMADIGEYVDVLAPVLQNGGVDVIFYFIRANDVVTRYSTLALLTKLLAHQKFASVFVDQGGVDCILALPMEGSPLETAPALTSAAILSISSYTGVLEQVCLLPQQTLSKLVHYTLWLLQCDDETARKNASLFWSISVSYRALLDAFDEHNGLEAFLTGLHTQVSPDDESEEPHYSKVLVHHMCLAIREYVRAHLVSRATNVEVRRTRPNAHTPKYRQLVVDDELVDAALKALYLSRASLCPNFDIFREKNGISLMLEIVEKSPKTTQTSLETAQFALDVMRIITVDQNGYYAFLDTNISRSSPPSTPRTDEPRSPGARREKPALSIILELVRNPAPEAPYVTLSALNVLLNFVYHVDKRGKQRDSRRMSIGDPDMAKQPTFQKALAAIRANNGISVLVSLLKYNWAQHDASPTQTSQADGYEVRAATCKVLLGLAKDADIRQVLNKKVSKLLPELIREPVSNPTGRHAKSWDRFKKATIDLISVLTGRDAAKLALQEAADPAMSKIDKASIVASTPIRYSSNELLELICKHLYSKGLHASAQTLMEEAKLSRDAVSAPPTLQLPSSTLAMQAAPAVQQSVAPTVTPITQPTSQTTVVSGPKGTILSPTPVKASESQNTNSNLSAPSPLHPSLSPSPGPKADGTPSSRRKRSAQANGSGFASPPPPGQLTPKGSVATPKSAGISQMPPLVLDRPDGLSSSANTMLAESKTDEISLDSIVRQFFFDQHRRCAKPYAVVPEFSLRHKHNCFIPKPNDQITVAPMNVTRRLFGRQIGNTYTYNVSKAMWRRFKYSKYKYMRKAYAEEGSCLTSVEFIDDSRMVVASSLGEMYVYNANTAEAIQDFQAYDHDVFFDIVVDRKTRKYALTLPQIVGEEVKLWDLNQLNVPINTFDFAVGNFSAGGENIIGAYEDGHLSYFDIATRQKKMDLVDIDRPGGTGSLRMPFTSFDDSLLLYDGVLWDARAGAPIHRFDKFTDYGPERFNPSGNDIIINSEIWDLRTFRLLKTVPSLDQTYVTFNNAGDVLFAAPYRQKANKRSQQFGNILRVIDATNYEIITEIVNDRNIVHMATNPDDTNLTLIEESRKTDAYMMGLPLESVCRMYEIGRVKSLEDEDDEEEEEEEDDDDDDAADALDFLDRLAGTHGLEDDGEEDDEDDLEDLDDEDLALLNEDDAEMMDFPDEDDEDDDDFEGVLSFD